MSVLIRHVIKRLIKSLSQELSSEDEKFSASDVERALWCSTVGAKLTASSAKKEQVTSKKSCGRKRKKSS